MGDWIMDKKVWIAYASTVLIWGSAFSGIKSGMASFTPEHLALLRLLIGTAGLLLFAFF